MNERKTLTHVDVFHMCRLGTFAGWPAVREIVGGKKIGFGGVVKNIVAGIDTGVKMRVDKARRNKAALSIDPLVNRIGIFFADELDAIAFKNHDAVFDDFMFSAVKADDEAPLDQCFHR